MTISTPPSPSVRAALAEVGDPARLTARFAHPDKYPPLARAAVPEDTLAAVSAALAGIEVAAWEHHLEGLARDAEASALQVDPALAARLPFVAGDRVLVLGDSITDDLLSWAAQLRVYVRTHLPDLGIEVINAGITGNTTQEAISRVDLLIAARPTWVIQMLGTNDARLHGATRVRMQSIGETRRNLELIARLIAAETDATLVRMTPPPVNDRDAEAWGAFQQQLITWSQADVVDIAQAVREQPGLIVDVHQALSAALAEDPGLMLPDGVHPSLLGQRRILEILLRALAVPEHSR